MTKVARWCFTVNNPGEWRPAFDGAQMDYLCYELERGEQGTEHVQGYVRFKGRKALNTAKHFICDQAHMEAAKGSEAQNKEYCSKEKNGTFVEWGTYKADEGAKGQGHRSDLTAAITKLKAGAPKNTVWREHPELLIKYPTGMEKAAEVLRGEPPLERQVHVTVLWGPTGMGKSHRARHAFPEAYCTEAKPVGTFDNYCGEDTVIMDEFDPMDVKATELNTWLDKWKVLLRCRYANKYAWWTNFIICTNIDPKTWYATADPAHRDAVQRRLAMIYHVTDQETVFNLRWWESGSAPGILASPGAAGSSTARPAPVRTLTPTSPDQTKGVKRTCHPSPSTSPEVRLARRPRLTSGASGTPTDSQGLSDGQSQQDPIIIDD